jgi:L-seryl-tRNA(Ser) seleniumtransferase
MSTSSRPRPPSVSRLLDVVAASEYEVSEPGALTRLAREVLAIERSRLASGAPPTTEDDLASAIVNRLDDLGDPGSTIPPNVINATGVILHTNLGRAPWPRAARAAAVRAASSYGYLELDAESGRRGPRFRAAEDHLVALTGAEDAMVATNNAAALALAVGLAGRRGSVVVSRGSWSRSAAGSASPR